MKEQKKLKYTNEDEEKLIEKTKAYSNEIKWNDDRYKLTQKKIKVQTKSQTSTELNQNNTELKHTTIQN
ncbi:hypothetical protein HYE41_03835 [Mycoplasmopsis bovis]|nr:hypothetical protein [Mycoplasmopsis bovis]QQH20754.1 hypothetical protein HYE41_03835 [Mycoplasmopsis bovis]